MTAANALNIPSFGPISNTASGTFSKAYSKFYQPGFANIGISFAGTTLTVQSENATAFSTSNPGFVALQSLANPGQIKRYSVTANQTFTQAGLGNNLFGVTTAITIAQDVPFFLYAVSNANNGENTIAFMISRFPNAKISPVAGKIAQSGNTNATTQGSFFSLATITAADYASSPCLCIGSFRMRYASSLWTVQTINNSDGIGQYQHDVVFSSVANQFGAAASSYFYANGGTAPQFSTNSVTYKVSMDNMLYLFFNFQNCTTAGVGAVTAQLASPYQVQGFPNGCSFLITAAGTTVFCTYKDVGSSINNIIEFIYTVVGAGSPLLLNSQIPLAAGTQLNATAYAVIAYT